MGASPQRTAAEVAAPDRILDAAIDRFGSHGFESVTIRDIAAGAGVSAALVMHYFESKDQLWRACAERVKRLVARHFDDARHGPAGLDPAGRILFAGLPPPVVRYVIRLLDTGGAEAQQLFDLITADLALWLEDASRSGALVPAADETSRAVLLLCMALGLQLVAPYIAADGADRDDHLVDRFLEPLVHLYADGLWPHR